MSIHSIPPVTTSGSFVRREQTGQPGAHLPVVIDDYSLQADPAVAADTGPSSEQASSSLPLISHQTAFQLSRYREYLVKNPHLTDLSPQYGNVRAAYTAQHADTGKTHDTQA